MCAVASPTELISEFEFFVKHEVDSEEETTLPVSITNHLERERERGKVCVHIPSLPSLSPYFFTNTCCCC